MLKNSVNKRLFTSINFLANKLKTLEEMYKEFDKNVDKLFEQEIKNPNAKKKQQKPIRVKKNYNRLWYNLNSRLRMSI